MRAINKLLDYPKVLPPNQCFMFTANSCIRQNNALVMGAGNAKAFKETYPNVDIEFGKRINHLSEFNVKFLGYGKGLLGAFQTKIDWKNNTPMNVLINSIEKLTYVANNNPYWIFHLPCPAIGRGGLEREVVFSLIETLPDNVYIYFK